MDHIDKVVLSSKTPEANFIGKNSFKRCSDEHAKAAYLYDGKTFISYEDKEGGCRPK
ncbi:hypothetical protein [Paenibacillus ehimensis]|uniref:hypothetical protein n=1 Tax=Paenibacillus ehimensis TaxID=79264 RepID=UPI000AC37153|nr:hypothetical protein [Paenibacillus ehimensis]